MPAGRKPNPVCMQHIAYRTERFRNYIEIFVPRNELLAFLEQEYERLSFQTRFICRQTVLTDPKFPYCDVGEYGRLMCSRLPSLQGAIESIKQLNLNYLVVEGEIRSDDDKEYFDRALFHLSRILALFEALERRWLPCRDEVIEEEIAA